MSLEIKQHGDGWKISMEKERWHFKSKEDMEKCLKTLLDLKDKHKPKDYTI